MIIACVNCIKRFEIDSLLIPKEGRLLQCIGCNHRWFFKNETIPEIGELPKNEDLTIFDSTDINQAKSLVIDNKINKPIEKSSDKVIFKKNKGNKKFNPLSLILVFTISFIAFILFVDTLQDPISNIVPNVDFLLYNLYETINDIVLFFSDLI